jgi:hypothetical protein
VVAGAGDATVVVGAAVGAGESAAAGTADAGSGADAVTDADVAVDVPVELAAVADAVPVAVRSVSAWVPPHAVRRRTPAVVATAITARVLVMVEQCDM